MKHQRQGENAIGVDSLCKSTRLTTSQRLGNVLPKTWAKRSWRPQQKALTTLGSTVRMVRSSWQRESSLLRSKIDRRLNSVQTTDRNARIKWIG
jgi:hypothetical protein